MKALLFLSALLLSATNAFGFNEDDMTGFRGPYVRDQIMNYAVGENQAIGFYTDGSLLNGVDLPQKAVGFVKIFRPRNRGWVTTLLNDVILYASREMRKKYPESERLQVGDTSAQFGGPISMHNSHQNGLDLDGIYYRYDKREMNPNINTTFDEFFVRDGVISENFDVQRNWYFMKTLVSTGEVNRILVDKVIKKRLCRYTQRVQSDPLVIETLRRLRPYRNHHHHFHLRLICPSDSPDCQNQLPPPEGTGC